MFKNSVKTAALLAGFGVLFMAIGSFFGTGGLIIGLLIGLVFVGGSYWFSDTLAVKAARAELVTEQQAPQLYAIVRDLTQRADMPMPKIYVSVGAAAERFRHGPQPASTRPSRSPRGSSRSSTRASSVACSPTRSPTSVTATS